MGRYRVLHACSIRAVVAFALTFRALHISHRVHCYIHQQDKMRVLWATLVAGLIASCSCRPNDIVRRGTSIIPSAPPIPTATPSPPENLRVDKKKQAKDIHDFFKAYGWLKKDEAIPDAKLPVAIRKIQKVLKIPQTGVYDGRMHTVLNKPRCGTVPRYDPSEALSNDTLQSRYVLWGPKWDRTTLTYRFVNYTADLPAVQQRSLVRYVVKSLTYMITVGLTK